MNEPTGSPYVQHVMDDEKRKCGGCKEWWLLVYTRVINGEAYSLCVRCWREWDAS